MQANGLPWSHRQVGLAFESNHNTSLDTILPLEDPMPPQGIPSSTRLDIWSSCTSIRGHTPQVVILISKQLPPGKSLPLTLGDWGWEGELGEGLDRSAPAEASSCPCLPLRSVFINSTRPQGFP